MAEVAFFLLKSVHPDMVDKQIIKLRNSGSVGLDYLSTGIIKQEKAELLPATTQSSNQIIEYFE